MIKEILQILIITFLLILCYDTIDIYLNQLNPKKEKELVVVRHEIEGTNKLLDKSIPYETSNFLVWPIALGFSSAFCFILFCCWLPVDKNVCRLSFAKSTDKDEITKIINENKVPVCVEYLKNQSNIRLLNDCKFDFENKNKIASDVTSKEITSQEAYEDENAAANDSDQSIDDKLTYEIQKRNEQVEQSKLCLSLSIPNLFNPEILPLPSTLNILKSDVSASASSLLQVDCCNSKTFCDLLLENRNVGKMGMPMPRSLHTDESLVGKYCFPNKFYENSCEIMTMKNKLEEENNFKNDDIIDETSILPHNDQIVELVSVYNNNVTLPTESTSTSEKSSNAQFLTYTDSDIKSIEKRLEAIEHGLKKTEVKTKDWGNRINLAESELVDLHEQMYTIFSKFEEDKRTNYIIVSKVSKESMRNKDYHISNVAETAQNNDSDDKHKKKERKKNRPVLDDEHEEVRSKKKHYQEVVPIQERLRDVQNYVHESDVDHTLNDCRIGIEHCSIFSAGENTEDGSDLFGTDIKMKSIGLEAMFEMDPQQEISTYSPKKAPYLSVTPHILPPYKRSTYAGTDSKAHLVKAKHKFKSTQITNDNLLRTRVR